MSATANVTKADYYEVLQVSREASDQELKTSYRKLAMQYHPDRNPNNPEAEEQFKACSEAYQVLSDPEKRAAYDRYGHAAFQGGRRGQSVCGGGIPGRSGGHLRRSVRRDVQHGRGAQGLAGAARARPALRPDAGVRRGGLRRGEGDQHPAAGGVRGLPRTRARANGKAPATCTQCAGRGQVRFQQGFFSVAKTCSRCSGTGTTITDPCPRCRGEGLLAKKHDDSGEGAGGGRAGHADPLSGRGRGGKVWRARRAICTWC